MSNNDRESVFQWITWIVWIYRIRMKCVPLVRCWFSLKTIVSRMSRIHQNVFCLNFNGLKYERWWRPINHDADETEQTWSDQLREKTFCCYWKYLIIIIFDKFWDGCVAHLMEKARYRHFEGRRDNGLAGIVPHLFAISKRTVSLLRCSCSCRDAKFFRLQSKFHSGNWQFRPCWSHDRTHSGERARRWQLFVQFPVLSMCGNEK